MTTMWSSRGFARPAMAILLAWLLAGGLALATWGGARAQGEVTLDATSGELGTYLVGPDGRTLYYFTRDVFSGASACSGGCAEAWPPLVVEDGATVTAGDGVTGVLGVIERGDGTRQVTHDGRPLYYWQGDQAAGDTTGQGVGDAWFVAQADGSMPANPPGITLATATTELGTFLTGRDGLTLYVFTADTVPGASTCEGDCATAWPPLTVTPGSFPAAGEGVTGVLGVAPRADGSWQVTYDGRPVYTWQGDRAAGDTTGQGVGGAWFVAPVDGSIPAE